LFSEGQLLYFTPFYFKNGNEPKNKFFLILKNINHITLVASLPTKVNNAPALMADSHGCVNYDERNSIVTYLQKTNRCAIMDSRLNLQHTFTVIKFRII